MEQSKRIPYISMLQVVGPIFVVLGHSLNGLSNNGWWYVFSKKWIYIFHMPLFFLISGYLLAFKGYLGEKKYGQFVVGKFKRLMIPYLFWNLLFWVPKFLAQDFIADYATLNIANALKAFIFPRQNVWGHTWFLMGLFVVYLLTPFFQNILGRKKLWINVSAIAACVILYTLPIGTEFLAFSDLHKDLLFFVIGCLLGQCDVEQFKSIMKKYKIWFILGAIVFSILSLIWFDITKPLHFIPCMFILFAFISVFVSIETLSNFCEKLASYSFSIYIMHWPFMLAVRIFFHQLLKVGEPMTIILMIVVGYILPIIVVSILRLLPFKKIRKTLNYLLGV